MPRKKKYFPNLFLLLSFALNFKSSFLFGFKGQTHKYLQRHLTKQKRRLENIFEWIQYVSCKLNCTINFTLRRNNLQITKHNLLYETTFEMIRQVKTNPQLFFSMIQVKFNKHIST